MSNLSIVILIAIIVVSYIGIISLLLLSFYKLPNSLIRLKNYFLRLNDLEYYDNSNIVYQNSYLACGAACFEMVLRYFKLKFKPNELTSLYELEGTSMLDLHNKCIEFHLKSEGVQFKNASDFAEHIKNDAVTSIVSFDFRYIIPYRQLFFKPYYYTLKYLLGAGSSAIRHWVVVESIDNSGKFCILDPYIGNIFMSKDKFLQLWNKKALIISK